MAVTAIWDVKDNLKRVIEYVSNPEKTNNDDYAEEKISYLENVIKYDTNDSKTEKQLYVSGLNCDPITAAAEMTSTKIRYNKTDSILAYHGYQSFAPGEVNAKTAHRIGVELAEKLWGDRFEVVISTHLDKGHIHNHFCINSVSFKDGKRYYDNRENYRLMRLESDKLCKQYGLSIVADPQASKGWHYSEWMADKMNKHTWRSVIRDDVDFAVGQSFTFRQFVKVLEVLGYEVKTGVKHVAVKAPGMERFVRLRSLSRDGRYTEDSINERIIKNVFISYDDEPTQYVKKFRYQGNIKNNKKLKGLKALYFKYMYMMGIIPKNAPNRKRVHFYFKEDLRYMDKITSEVTFLCRYKLNSADELKKYRLEAETKLNDFIKERRCIYNKIKRCRNTDLKEKLKRDVETLSAEIKELRKGVKICDDIETRSNVIKEKIKKVYDKNLIKENKEQEVKKDECWRRNSRSGG